MQRLSVQFPLLAQSRRRTLLHQAGAVCYHFSSPLYPGANMCGSTRDVALGQKRTLGSFVIIDLFRHAQYPLRGVARANSPQSRFPARN